MIIGLLSITACGNQEDQSPKHIYTTYSNDTLHFYVELFIQASIATGNPVDASKISVEFADNLPSDENTPKNSMVVGRCFYADNHIKILKSFWDTAPLSRRKQLMFHELGHCAMYRPHVDEYLSIMNPALMSDGKFIYNETTLTHELFHPLEKGFYVNHWTKEYVDEVVPNSSF